MEKANRHEKRKEVEGVDVESEMATKALSLMNFDVVSRGDLRPHKHIEEGMNHAIIGQEDAVKEIIRAINREKLRDPTLPVTTVALLGPTGTGKTEFAKELARQLHPQGGGYLEINSESYKYGHNISSLIGSPPGYVGSEIVPALSTKELKKPLNVVLFDEIEKGSLEYWDIVMQAIGSGKVPLARGGHADFTNSIIILTSNLGASEMAKKLRVQKFGLQSGDSAEPNKKEIENEAIKELKKYFRPEFINRIDRSIVFNFHSDENLARILERHVEKKNKTYMEQAGVSLVLTPEVLDALVASAEDRRENNARAVIRKYKEVIESELAEFVNTGGVNSGECVYATLSPDTPETASLAERVDWRKNEMPHVTKHIKKLQAKAEKAKETANLPAVINSNRAISLAAAAGIAALFVGDYLSSRRTRRA